MSYTLKIQFGHMTILVGSFFLSLDLVVAQFNIILF
jgi:hypothetical protein